MKVNVVSPWYPDKSLGQVYSGAFVQKQVLALRKVVLKYQLRFLRFIATRIGMFQLRLIMLCLIWRSSEKKAYSERRARLR